MKVVKVIPDGWPCLIEDCRPGHFMSGDQLCFKSEYGTSEVEAFCETGEYFVTRNIYVQPVRIEITNQEQ